MNAANSSAEERDLVEQIRTVVAQRLHHHIGEATLAHDEQRDLVDQLLFTAMDEAVVARLGQGKSTPDPDEEARIAQRVRDKLLGLGGLQRLLDDESIENINVNGHNNVFVRYADGRREQVGPVADSDEELIDLVRMLAARAGGNDERRFDRASPRLSMQLPDGSRLFALMAVSPWPVLSIRRHRFLKVTLDDLVDGSLAVTR